MPIMPTVRRLILAVATGALLGVAPVATMAQQPSAATNQLADALWSAARSGGTETTILDSLRKFGDAPEYALLKSGGDALAANLAMREQARAKELERVTKELNEALAAESTPVNLSKALKAAVEMHVLSTDKNAVLNDARIKDLIKKSDLAARAAEARSDWLAASTLFSRLQNLLEEDATYKPDVRRLGDRLGMIRLYAPEKLWELRNKARLQENLKALPPYNATGEDFRAKLKSISKDMVKQALGTAAERHVEGKGLRPLLLGALESIRTMVTTSDLQTAFPGIADEAKRSEFLAVLDAKVAVINGSRVEPDRFEMDDLLTTVPAAANRIVGIPTEAVLHEMGNGGFDRLDEFSQIIWPDEVARFNRLMTGNFIGVGIQIQVDEETQLIKVVAPIEGTPAFRAGIKSGDFIRRIDNKDAMGMTIDQAVEQITGNAGTKVRLTMEREAAEMEFPLTRERIPLRTAKGWKRSGPKDDDWDWYIDPERKIGYVRLTQFQGSTTDELNRALDQMRSRGGFNGLILDLRFNPGGLLDQAVSVSNTFVSDGLLVYTKSGDGKIRDQRVANKSGVRAGRTPLVVLINEGSASASEIVSGALKYYADKGKIDAVLIGARSYGKGSVQTVAELDTAMMKITQQYYFLPDDRLIHRRDHATQWGVDPHVKVEMLPKQIIDSLTLRQDADVSPGQLQIKEGKPAPDPDRLLTENLDLQLQAGLVLLQSKVVSKQLVQAK